MKIAVTYEGGNVFQHFGHSQYFKVYDVEGGAVRASEVIPTDGFGHGALAGFLRGRGVEALICGGIGGGAIAALAEAGIRVYAGVSGSADGAVQAFLRGELAEGAEAACSHHGHGGHGEEGCGHGDKEDGCGHGEHGGCGGHEGHGCGGYEEGHGCGHGEGGHACH